MGKPIISMLTAFVVAVAFVFLVRGTAVYAQTYSVTPTDTPSVMNPTETPSTSPAPSPSPSNDNLPGGAPRTGFGR
jgi:hypothetical protein